MPTCITCGQQTDNNQALMEVLTQHIRSMSGDKRAQALGEVVPAPVCDQCLDTHIAMQADGKAGMLRQGLLFGGMLVVGIPMTLLPLKLPMQLKFFGAAFMLVGVVGLAMGIRATAEHSRQVKQASLEANRLHFLPQVAAKALPKKSGENDITYVPWHPGLCHMPLQALVDQYHLVPQIAGQLRTRAQEAFEAEKDAFKT